MVSDFGRQEGGKSTSGRIGNYGEQSQAKASGKIGMRIVWYERSHHLRLSRRA